jgi:putative intracellular protease/amidase
MKGCIVKYPNCIIDEVLPTQELLADRVDLRVIDLSEVKHQLSADFLIFPGGSCDEAIVHRELQKLIQKVNSKKGVLAGICNGALVLASAGVLISQNCTHTAHPKYAPLPEFKELLEIAGELFKESTYVDEDVVISDNIITAKPHATQEFARAIGKSLGLKVN